MCSGKQNNGRELCMLYMLSNKVYNKTWFRKPRGCFGSVRWADSRTSVSSQAFCFGNTLLCLRVRIFNAWGSLVGSRNSTNDSETKKLCLQEHEDIFPLLFCSSLLWLVCVQQRWMDISICVDFVLAHYHLPVTLMSVLLIKGTSVRVPAAGMKLRQVRLPFVSAPSGCAELKAWSLAECVL